MGIEVKKFSGILDTDSGSDFILPTSHKYALNGRFYGTQAGMRFQNIKGNTQIPNADLPNTGVNETVGAFFDQQKLRIIYFNYNSGGKNGIYLYDIKAGATTTLLQCLSANCPTDILGFTLNDLIVSVNIIFGDSQQGDIIYFIDCLFRPTKLNIDRALVNGYGTYQRSYLEVIKEPSSIDPVAAYEDDNSVTVNNLNGQLFNFKIRWIFDDNDKSVTSAWSIMPLPQGNQDPALSSDPTINAVIKIAIPTGKPNVKKIEILGTTSLGQTWGDFFSIDVLNKADLSIPDNDIFIYEFRNDKIYAPIDINESLQLFDWVPRTANAQEVLLTNILIYGGIKENFNSIVPDITLTPALILPTDSRLGIVAIQSGDTLGGTGNIHIVVVGKAGIPISGGSAEVIAGVQTTSNSLITYVQSYTTGVPTTTDIITGLAVSAISFGFTVVSLDANNLIISKTGASLQYYNITNTYGSGGLNDSVPAYDFLNQESLGIVYFDGEGRSDGVFTKANITCQTGTYSATQQPYLTIEIFNQPPIEAHSYQLVRIPNPTKSRFEYWITDRAYQGIDQTTGVTYAYLSIENLNQYIKDNPSTAKQLSYSWATNDRVKIIENMVSSTLFTVQNDYQIINSLFNPTINGVPYTGQFLQILLPTVASGITIDGTKPNFNFLIEFYTPAKSLAENANIYYEFGERYAIGNIGLSNRYHQGKSGNQNTDGTGHATILSINGDAYLRPRTINAGNKLEFTITAGGEFDFDNFPNNVYSLPQTFTQTFLTPEYTVQSVGIVAGFGSNWWLQILQGGLSFNIKGQIKFEAISAFPGTNSITIRLSEQYSGGPTNTDLFNISNVAAGQVFTAEIDFTWNPAHNPEFAYFVIQTTAGVAQLKCLGGYLNFIETGSSFTTNIVDQNFSDFYASAVNSNSRVWAIQPNIEETYIGTLVRYGLPYLASTNINNVNRFYEQNSDQYDNARGNIRRLKVRGAYMRVFQDVGTGEVPVFQNMLTNTSGQTQIGQSENVINNIQYYAGMFGMGGQYSSLVSGKSQDYFVDPIRGYQVRVSQDGIIPISELYYGQYTIRSLITKYNKTYTRPDGGTARILGYYSFFDEQYICILQGGTNGSDTIPSYAFSFNEKRNGYCSFYDFANTEFGLCAEDVDYNFKNGLMYIHNNTTNYANFFGVQYSLQIQLVFNINLPEKKVWESVSLLCDDVMECPEIYTSLVSGGLMQESSLLEDNFLPVLEGMPTSNFLRNKNNGGLTNGETLRGNWIVVTFQKTNAQKLINLSTVYIKFIDSPLTPR